MEKEKRFLLSKNISLGILRNDKGESINLTSLLKEYSEQQTKSDWVSVEDGLPLVTGFYTVSKPTKPYVLGLYFDSDKQFRYNKQVHNNITHWQPLPQPPKTK